MYVCLVLPQLHGSSLVPWGGDIHENWRSIQMAYYQVVNWWFRLHKMGKKLIRPKMEGQGGGEAASELCGLQRVRRIEQK